MKKLRILKSNSKLAISISVGHKRQPFGLRGGVWSPISVPVFDRQTNKKMKHRENTKVTTTQWAFVELRQTIIIGYRTPMEVPRRSRGRSADGPRRYRGDPTEVPGGHRRAPEPAKIMMASAAHEHQEWVSGEVGFFLGLLARLGLTCDGQTDDTLSRLCWTRLS